jgi:hypothetical protein
MLEASGAGPVWRPTLAPHPVKNLVLEPVAVYKVAATGTVDGDVMYFDSLTVDLVVDLRNMGRQAVNDVLVNAQVYLGNARVKSVIERSHQVPAGYEHEETLEGLTVAAGTPASDAFLAMVNAQDPYKPIMMPGTVDADFVVSMRGPLDRAHVANARSVTKMLPLQTRSGSRPRLLEEV